jgi:hypothetical protein
LRDGSVAGAGHSNGATEICHQKRSREEDQAAAGGTAPLAGREFPTLAKAEAAAGPTSLAADVAGKVWLFTLGAKGGSTPGAAEVVEIGPIAAISAPEYLLRINNAGGPPGVKTPVHTHPGSETFYVLKGQLSQKTPSGMLHLDAGQALPGHGAGMPMEVSSSDTSDLNALVMFVVDATKPFSSPAKF